VEVALGLYYCKGCRAVKRGFNPCFRGSRPRTLEIERIDEEELEFQSLFSWKSPSDMQGIFLDLGFSKFQSLFSWKSPSDIGHNRPKKGWTEVSILVFVEVALGRPEWGTTSLPVGCFNPCFRGSRPRTFNLPTWYIWLKLFQSLFSWKSPSDVPGNRTASWLGQFQSLFSWKSPSDANLDCNVLIEASFNPCFRGSRPRTKDGGAAHTLNTKFQSLFSWKSPSDWHRRRQAG